jgi:hypothetical protein
VYTVVTRKAQLQAKTRNQSVTAMIKNMLLMATSMTRYTQPTASMRKAKPQARKAALALTPVWKKEQATATKPTATKAQVTMVT